MKFLISIMVLLITGNSSASESIKFHDDGDNTFVVELTSTEDLAEKRGLEIISEASIKKCGEKPANFGKYRFAGKEQISATDKASVDSFKMIQQLFCGEINTIAQEPTKPISADKKKQLEEQVIILTDDYLEYLAKQKFRKAYSLISASLKEGTKYREWKASKKQHSSQPGELIRSETWKVTTYIDPPSSQQKGIYIAADFDREYSNLPIFCGYLVWYFENAELKVMREDIGTVKSDQMSGMKTADLETIKSKFGCKPLTSKGSG